ncbi:GNAT family N-acetyltransferase [Phenylobacterium hankyongense]|uniref:GNAT family N-acetyltransferase n=1 Tax=Phenylobacterium hankyongense TaxID=1813876 RepID=UPI001FB47E47|nr:GNAT family N-acetyltransferase [Phenylobacterium hankyongense]
MRASSADAATLQNLLLLYMHDFSEFWAWTAVGDLEPDGRYEDYPLDPYWDTPGWRAVLFEADGALAGFALVNDHAHSSRPVDHAIAEFFVARKYRRQGLGKLAAHRLFGEARGQWEVAVVRKNLAAQAFWRRTVAECPAAREVTEFDLDDARWNGPILRFRT